MSAERNAPESKRAIYAALFANLAIGVTKLTAAFFSGSSALLSEGVHSLVDTSNELLLLYGMKRAEARRSREHPLGHGRELYFWSFIVALLVFALGAGISIYEGIAHFRHPEPNRQPLVSYGVLAFSALFDGYSFVVAVRQFNQTKGDETFFQAVKRSKDPTTFAVVLEDGAALTGIVIALVGVLSAQLLRDPRFDSLASIGIGLVLAGTAALMARECKALLIGESASPELEAALLAIISADRAVAHANGLITLHLAPQQVVVAVSAAFANELTTVEIEACVARLEAQIRKQHPQVNLLFVKPQTSHAFAQSPLVREIAESEREAAGLSGDGAAAPQPAPQKLT
jgi:cation diffusion facilitator family transporter